MTLLWPGQGVAMALPWPGHQHHITNQSDVPRGSVSPIRGLDLGRDGGARRDTQFLDEAKVPWYLGTLVPWYQGTLVPRYLGTQVPWYQGTLVPRYLGTLVPWYQGTLVPR